VCRFAASQDGHDSMLKDELQCLLGWGHGVG
jgi:hypothetical protein